MKEFQPFQLKKLPRLCLPHSDRVTVPIHKNLEAAIVAAQFPGEHKWQTVQRLLIAGLIAESNANTAGRAA